MSRFSMKPRPPHPQRKGKRILAVVGTRPQILKHAVVGPALVSAGHTVMLVHSGQHYAPEMSSDLFRELDMVPPEVNLHCAEGGKLDGLPDAAVVMTMADEFRKIIQARDPHVVLVYGDCTTTLAAAIATNIVKKTVTGFLALAHVEAGLRSGNLHMAEETNRWTTDHLSDFLFPPTARAQDNLRKEGIVMGPYFVENVGDVMLDLAMKAFSTEAEEEFPKQPYVLATVHRAENVDNAARFEKIVEGLASIPFPVYFVVHPRVAAKWPKSMQPDYWPKNVHPVSPMSFLVMRAWLRSAHLCVTDSGGLQKEANFHRVPTIVLREETEWTEINDGGWSALAGYGSAAISFAARVLLEKAAEHGPAEVCTEFGDGTASAKIAAALLR